MKIAKEELKKEAEEYLTKLLKRLNISKEDLAENQPEFQSWEKMNFISLNVSNVSKAYLASAEPREKRIAKLEKENAELKEIIKDYMIIARGGNITVCSVPEENRCINVLKLNEQAEQFLKEK